MINYNEGVTSPRRRSNRETASYNSKVRNDPVQRTAIDAEGTPQTFDKDLVVCRIEGGAEVKQAEKCHFTRISGNVRIGQHFEHGSLCGVKASVRRLLLR